MGNVLHHELFLDESSQNTMTDAKGSGEKIGRISTVFGCYGGSSITGKLRLMSRANHFYPAVDYLTVMGRLLTG